MNVFTKPVLSTVTRGICIGNILAAENKETLTRHKIGYVVSVYPDAEWLGQLYKNLGIGHIIIPVRDNQPFDNDLDRIAGTLLDKAFPRTRLISEEGLRSVLVHCGQGISRAPAYVITFLMWCYGMPLDEALRIVASCHPPANPSPQVLDSFLRCIGKGFEDEESYEAYKTRWSRILFLKNQEAPD